MSKVPKGERLLTRKQRTKVATFLIQAALHARAPEGVSTTGASQLGYGLAALALDGNVNLTADQALNTTGLLDVLDSYVGDGAGLAAAWELAVWPPAAPTNTKKAEPALATA